MGNANLDFGDLLLPLVLGSCLEGAWSDRKGMSSNLSLKHLNLRAHNCEQFRASCWNPSPETLRVCQTIKGKQWFGFQPLAWNVNTSIWQTSQQTLQGRVNTWNLNLTAKNMYSLRALVKLDAAAITPPSTGMNSLVANHSQPTFYLNAG